MDRQSIDTPSPWSRAREALSGQLGFSRRRWLTAAAAVLANPPCAPPSP